MEKFHKAIVNYLSTCMDEKEIASVLTCNGILMKRVMNLKQSDNSSSSVYMNTLDQFLRLAARKSALGLRKIEKISDPMEKLAFLMELAESIFHHERISTKKFKDRNLERSGDVEQEPCLCTISCRSPS
ncbi:hypothetical protein Trydic_g11708 [Trypoxylus dichotomus]